jgi:hypothetical protein
VNKLALRLKQSASSVSHKLWSAIVRKRPTHPEAVIHDPDASRPHDLDDPFFDRKVQQRVGAVLANAARKKVKP